MRFTCLSFLCLLSSAIWFHSLDGLVIKTSALSVRPCYSNHSTVLITSDLLISTQVAALPDALHYGVSARTGQLVFSLLWLLEIACLICLFFLDSSFTMELFLRQLCHQPLCRQPQTSKQTTVLLCVLLETLFHPWDYQNDAQLHNWPKDFSSREFQFQVPISIRAVGIM